MSNEDDSKNAAMETVELTLAQVIGECVLNKWSRGDESKIMGTFKINSAMTELVVDALERAHKAAHDRKVINSFFNRD